MQDKIIKTLAHDLRSPPGMIKNTCQLLLMSEDDPEKIKHLNQCIAYSLKELDLVDSILFTHNMDQNSLQILKDPLNLNDFFEMVEENCIWSCLPSGKTLQSPQTTTLDSSNKVETDIALFLFCLRNLVRNLADSQKEIQLMEPKIESNHFYLSVSAGDLESLPDDPSQEDKFTCQDLALSLKILDKLGFKVQKQSINQINCLEISTKLHS